VCVHVCACGFPVFLPEMVNKVEYNIVAEIQQFKKVNLKTSVSNM